MKRTWILIGLLAVLVLAAATPRVSSNNQSSTNAPVYTSDGNLKFPTQYREWVYLSEQPVVLARALIVEEATLLAEIVRDAHLSTCAR